MEPKHCVGYGEYKGRCGFPIAEDSPYWCVRCEVLRRKTITRQLEGLVAGFGEPAGNAKGGNADG